MSIYKKLSSILGGLFTDIIFAIPDVSHNNQHHTIALHRHNENKINEWVNWREKERTKDCEQENKRQNQRRGNVVVIILMSSDNIMCDIIVRYHPT